MFTSVRPTPPPEGSLRGWCSACDLLKQISPLSSSPKQTPALLFTLAYLQSSESDLCYVKELGKGEGGVQEKCIHLRLESEAQASSWLLMPRSKEKSLRAGKRRQMKPTPDPSQQAGRRAASSSCLRHPEMSGLRYVHMAVTTRSVGYVLDTLLPADPMGTQKPQRGPTTARSCPAGF